MSGDWDDDFTAVGASPRAAQTNLAASRGIAPEAASQALKHAPTMGVNPVMAVRDVKPVIDMAGIRGQSAILNNSSHVNSWAASDPVKTAATRDDFVNFAELGAQAKAWWDNANSVVNRIGQQKFEATGLLKNLTDPIAGTFHALPRDIPLGLQAASQLVFPKPLKQRWEDIKAIGRPLGEGMNLIPGFAAFTSTANAAYVQPVASIFDLIPREPGVTKEEQHRKNVEQIGATLFALSPARAGSGRPPIIDEGNVTPQVPRIGGPREPIIDAEFHPVPDKQNTIAFKEAAEADAESIATMQEVVAGSATHTRAPELIEDYLNNHTPAGQSLVTVPSEAIAKLWSEGHEVFPAYTAAINDGLTTGQPVQVPLGTYLAETSGKPFAEALNAATRFREEGVSVEEGKALPQGDQVETETIDAPLAPQELQEHFGESANEAVGIVKQATQRITKELGLTRVVEDAKALGMTAKQFEGYSARLEEWEATVEERLIAKMTAQYKKEKGPDFKAAVALHREEGLAAIEELPHVKAWRDLATDELFKLDRAKVLESYPDLQVPKALTKKDGLSADDAAELTGFETGGQLVQALHDLRHAIEASGSRNLDAYIKLRADVYAKEQARVMMGYDMSPKAIMREVAEAVDSPIIENLLIDQLKEYAEEQGLPFDKAALQTLAEQSFGKLRVKDALRTKSFVENVRRLGNKTEEGLLGDKVDKAFQAKQKQFLNFQFIKQSLALTKDYAKTQKKFTRWARKASNKNIDQVYMNYVHGQLMSMGYKVKRDLPELLEQIGGKSLFDFVLEREANGEVIFYEPFPETPLVDMSVDEYGSARDTLSSLVHNGRREAGVVILGKRSSYQDLIGRVKANGEALGNRLTPERIEVRNPIQNFTSAANAYMLKGEQLLDEMDINDPQGPLNQAVVYPLQESKGRENDMLANITKQLKEFGKTQPKAWLGTMKLKIDVPELMWTNPQTGLQEKVLTTRGKLVKLMLNLGNEVNLSKLLEGYNWDYGDVMSAVHAHATAADWNFVQKVWDLHEELWPEISRVYRNLSGVAPKRRLPMKVQTPFGIKDGGYFPISYDKLRTPDVRVMSEDSIWGEEYSSGLPSNPYTKGVTAYVAPLDLTFEGLNKSLGQVIHDLAFREALSQSVRVLGNDTVRKAVQANFGPSYTAQLRPWLEYIARQRVFDDRSAGFLENFFSGLRSNITFVGLAYRRTSAMIHFTVAMSDSVAEVGAKDLGEAALDIIKTPGQFNYWMDFISTNSPEIRHRMLNMDQNIREAFIHLAEKQGFLEEAQKFGYHMLAFSDIVSAAPTWLAGYRQEIARGVSPEEAFQVADKRVRQAHGASHPVDIAAVQRGGQGFWAEVGKSSFGLFLSFMNHSYNRLWAIGRRFGRGFDQAKAGEWAGASRDWSKASAMTFGYVIMASVLVTAEKTWFKTGNPIPKHFLDWVDGVAHTTFGGLPGVGTLIEAVEHKESESPLERAVTTNVHTVQNAWNKLTGHDGKVSKKWLQQALESAGYWTGKVPGAIAKDTQYIWNISTGAERPPKDVNEFFQVLITGGRAKK